MFGYVTPCKMELKIKDFEKFKSYYCGLCISLKENYGNLPRLTLNYDMTFLALLLDSLEESKNKFIKSSCISHPFKKRIMIVNNNCLNYAAFNNFVLAYYKLLDDYYDDKSIKSKISSIILNPYFKKISKDLKPNINYINSKLKELSSIEKNFEGKCIDQICEPFSALTAFILSSYKEDAPYKEDLYYLGYNLGKWIYLIDALDDLEKDIKNNKFNPINVSFNKYNLSFEKLYSSIEDRIDFLLVTCAQQCLYYLNRLPLKKNIDILYNILQYGLMEKMDKVFKRSELKDDEPI